MIGQSKINTFFKRQSQFTTTSEDRMKTAGSASECTLPLKRKRDETASEVHLPYY